MQKKLLLIMLFITLVGCQTITSTVPTAVPAETQIALPTLTEEPIPSPTVVSPTATSPSVSTHDPVVWHLPAFLPGFEHHHGVNPEDYVNVFGSTLSDYLATYGTVSYPWQTPDENSPIGFGHHHGYVWLYDQARSDDGQGGCELFNNTGNLPTGKINCVTDVLMEIHTDGTQAHLRKRFHSHYIFMRVCDQALTQCGTVATGGWVDYGILETPYKEAHCPLPGIDPEVPEGHEINIHQPPYRTSTVEWRGDRVVQFWNGMRPNPIVASLYPENPNATVGVAWSTLDAWGIIDPTNCADPSLDVFGADQGMTGLNNSLFQIFAVYLYDHPSAPFVGWTNRWGHIVENCLQASTDCVPFIVTEGVPDGAAMLNRRVKHGDPEAAPLLEFDSGNGELLAPEG